MAERCVGDTFLLSRRKTSRQSLLGLGENMRERDEGKKRGCSRKREKLDAEERVAI